MGDTVIEPKDYTETKVATGFRVNIQELILFKSVTVRVELLNELGNMIQLKYIVLEGDDYMNWNNDDSYILQKVAEKLEVVIV